jgi:hypothetical protein
MSIIATPSPGGQNCLSNRAITQAVGLGDWQQGEKQAPPSIGLEHLAGDCMEAPACEGARHPAALALLSYTNFLPSLGTWTRSRLSQGGTSISPRPPDACRRAPPRDILRPCPRTTYPVCEAGWSVTTPALAVRHVVGSRVCLPLGRKTWFHLPVEPARAEHPEDRLAELPGRPRFRLPASPSTSSCQQNPAEAQADPPRAWLPPPAFCRRNRGPAW